MNKYKVGIYFEYRVKKILEGLGAYVIRSARSHTVADLIVIHKNSIKLLQLKFSKKKSYRDVKVMDKIFKEYRIPVYLLHRIPYESYILYKYYGELIKYYEDRELRRILEVMLKDKNKFIFS